MEGEISFHTSIGSLAGVIMGWAWGPPNGNAILGAGACTFLGWLIAAAVFHNRAGDK